MRDYVISFEVDGKAWVDNPDYRYVYNKIWLCEKQNIRCAPAGVEPEKFPVFYKPIYNMYSLGAYSFKAESRVERNLHPGMFWMEYLGKPELGIEENRRLGYLFCNDKKTGFKIKSHILDNIIERID